jgi:hypothetical protein
VEEFPVANTFADLSDKEKDNFYAQLKALGIDPATVPESIVADGSQRLHPDPALTTVPTKIVQVKDLAQLKQYWGVSDQVFAEPGKDTHIKYPAPLDDARAKLLSTGRRELTEQAISADEKQTVSTAMEAYMNGNSSKVPQQLVDLVNTLHFPMDVQVAAAQNIVINSPFQVSQSLVAGTITINPPGYIQVIGDASITAQQIIVNS